MWGPLRRVYSDKVQCIPAGTFLLLCRLLIVISVRDERLTILRNE